MPDKVHAHTHTHTHKHKHTYTHMQGERIYIYRMGMTTLVTLYHISQGRSTKIKTGQAIDDVTQTRGAGGMPPPPGKVLKFRCSVSTFGAILGPSTLQ